MLPVERDEAIERVLAVPITEGCSNDLNRDEAEGEEGRAARAQSPARVTDDSLGAKAVPGYCVTAADYSEDNFEAGPRDREGWSEIRFPRDQSEQS